MLLQTNINNTRSDAALLVKALADLSREIEQRLAQGGAAGRAAFDARVRSLMTDVPDLPNFSRFHDVFRDDPSGASNEGHMREAFYMAYDEANCEYLKLASPDIDERLKNGPGARLGQLRHSVSARASRSWCPARSSRPTRSPSCASST